jgi:GPH family glycoside/pentoside/hexuronide:cation symporter
MLENDPIHWKSKHAVAAQDKIPVRQKVCYGLGGLTDFFFVNIVQGLAIPIFAIAMKMDPFLLGIALASTKVISALADPFVGILSDKTRTRWGRRKPFMLVSACIGAVMLPLIWVVPETTPLLKFVYISAFLSFFFLINSFYSAPYGALGFEMTGDYDERTRIFAWKNYVGMIGIFSGAWFYWFTLRPVFGNEIIGVRWLSALGGVIMVICAVFVARGTHEIVETRIINPADRIPVFKALRTTFSNRTFLLVQGSILVVALGTGVDGTIGMYLHVHYTCAGNKEMASFIGGAGGTLATLSTFVAMPLGLWISTHLGKREASLAGIGFMLIGALSIPWMLTPALPWLVVGVWVITTIGAQCSGLMYGSMVADICDEDELKTGQRREGSYAAAGSFLNKMVQIVVLILSGLMPRLIGYTDFTVAPTMSQLERMKVMLILTQVVGIGLAFFFLWFYPLTRDRCTAIRRQLNLRQRFRQND